MKNLKETALVGYHITLSDLIDESSNPDKLSLLFDKYLESLNYFEEYYSTVVFNSSESEIDQYDPLDVLDYTISQELLAHGFAERDLVFISY